MNISEAKLHPDSIFESPYTVYNDPNITLKDKIDILESWKNQLALETNASQEGMQSKKDDLDAAQRLKVINNLLSLLAKEPS